MKSIDNYLRVRELEIEKEIEDYAVKIFEIYILPWLKRKGYSFIAGNGTYLIWDESKSGNTINSTYSIENEELPKRIREILEQEIYYCPNGSNELGCWMPDYYHGKDK